MILDVKNPTLNNLKQLKYIIMSLIYIQNF